LHFAGKMSDKPRLFDMVEPIAGVKQGRQRL
jgi:hypothetical protein